MTTTVGVLIDPLPGVIKIRVGFERTVVLSTGLTVLMRHGGMDHRYRVGLRVRATKILPLDGVDPLQDQVHLYYLFPRR